MISKKRGLVPCQIKKNAYILGLLRMAARLSSGLFADELPLPLLTRAGFDPTFEVCALILSD